MKPRQVRLLFGSLVLLGGCAASGVEASPRHDSPAALPSPTRAVDAGVARAHWGPGPPRVEPASTRDAWDLLEPTGVLNVEGAPLNAPSAPPQGPGPRFKPQESLGSTRLLFAYQSMDEDYWTPIENHFAFGLETSFERKGDWIGGEGGLSFVMTDGEDLFVDPVGGNTKVKASLIMVELYGGIHRTFFRDSRLNPYVGAGASMFYVDGEQEFKPSSGADRCDSGHELTFGLYAHGGLSYQINELFQVGLDLRVVGLTEVDVLEGTGDVDYQQLALFIGYGG